MINIYTINLPVKSPDIVFLDIAIATLSKIFNFLKEVTIELNRFSHRSVKKNGKKTGRVKKNSLECGPKNLKFRQ